MGWREYAQTVRDTGHDRHVRHNSSDKQAIVPIVPALPAEETARVLLADWHRRLSSLDVYDVPDGFSQNRWGQLVLDCSWLYEEWASRLVRKGWSALDLWTVVPSQPGWGGLGDRLQGSRSLLIDDTGKAYWRRMGVSFELCRGVGEALRGSEARLVWGPRQARSSR